MPFPLRGVRGEEDAEEEGSARGGHEDLHPLPEPRSESVECFKGVARGSGDLISPGEKQGGTGRRRGASESVFVFVVWHQTIGPELGWPL